jgi:G3E family GTPase
VENEFGDRVSSSIESAVVLSGSGAGADVELVELPNGCVCCAASNSLTDALTRLLRMPGPRRFDHVVVEASGLADPGPVAAALWVDDALETMLRLDAIITVVDAHNLPSYLYPVKPSSDNIDKARLAEKQVAVADAILLNKIDLLTEPELSAVRERVAALASPATPLRETVRCETPLADLLCMRAYDAHRARVGPTADLLLLRENTVHARGVGAISVTFDDTAFDAALLDRAIGGLLWENGKEDNKLDSHREQEIWRVKALVNVRDCEMSVLYQAVHTLFENESSGILWIEGEKRVSKFVFIGRALDRDKLRNALLAAAVCTPLRT